MSGTAHWTCTVPGGRVIRCDDLPLEVYATIAKDTGKHWHELLLGPLSDEMAGLALYRACCAHASVDPGQPTLRVMIDAYNLVDDDVPDTFEDGIPDPKADAPATTG